MLRVTNCKKNIIPSAIHVDGTARLQTVKKHKIKTSMILLITLQNNWCTNYFKYLFNDAGEPLVETPLDALISSIKTNLDYLVIENNLINLKLLNYKKKLKLLKKLSELRNIKIDKNISSAIKLITKIIRVKNYSKK